MDYIKRMEQELEKLVERGTKADKALCALDLDKDEYAMLYSQTKIMSAYVDILEARIRYAKEKRNRNVMSSVKINEEL